MLTMGNVELEQCRIFSRLVSNEMVTGPVPSPKHRARLSGSLLNLKWGQATVREMIVADIRAALDLGALDRAGTCWLCCGSSFPTTPKPGNAKIETSSICAPLRCKNQSVSPPRRRRDATAPTLPKYFPPTALRHTGMHRNNRSDSLQQFRTVD